MHNQTRTQSDTECLLKVVLKMNTWSTTGVNNAAGELTGAERPSGIEYISSVLMDTELTDPQGLCHERWYALYYGSTTHL